MNYPKCLGAWLLLFLLCPILKGQTSESIQCFYHDEQPNDVGRGGECSHNGNSHTPDGTLRVLVVFAGFEGWEGNPTDVDNPQPPLNGWEINSDISEF